MERGGLIEINWAEEKNGRVLRQKVKQRRGEYWDFYEMDGWCAWFRTAVETSLGKEWEMMLRRQQEPVHKVPCIVCWRVYPFFCPTTFLRLQYLDFWLTLEKTFQVLLSDFCFSILETPLIPGCNFNLILFTSLNYPKCHCQINYIFVVCLLHLCFKIFSFNYLPNTAEITAQCDPK